MTVDARQTDVDEQPARGDARPLGDDAPSLNSAAPQLVNDAPPAGSLTARAAWLMLARTLAFACSFALPLLLVRRLSREDLGVYRQVFLLVTTAINVLPIGFHMSAFYFLPRERERQGQIVLHITLVFALLAGAASLALYLRPALLVSIFGSGELVPLAPLVALLLFLWVGTSHLEYMALANQEVRVATLLIVALQVTRAVLMLSAALAFGTVRALLWAAIAQGVLQAAALVVYMQMRFRAFGRGVDFALLRRQLSYALPLGLAGLLAAVQLDAHNYFVSHFYGAAAFAVYSTGCFNLPLIHILSDSVGAVMIPRVNVLQKEGRAREIVELTAAMLRKLALVYFACYALLLVVAREFVLVLFTAKYLASLPVFVVNLTMILVYLLSNAYDPVMRAYAEHRFFLLRLRAVLLGALLAALWLWTGRLGLVGVITLVVCCNFAERVATLWKAARVVGFRARDVALLKDVGKLALAATAAGVAAAFLRAAVVAALPPFFVLVLCGSVFTLVYALAVVALRVVRPEERAAVTRRLARLPRLGRRLRAAEPVV
ncbi:MAG TPA: oligosaccharide flippase family protein [Pyrinomonadaceae bacterium]|jgi:O-antigen/teichoic acid export membrane protein